MSLWPAEAQAPVKACLSFLQDVAEKGSGFPQKVCEKCISLARGGRIVALK